MNSIFYLRSFKAGRILLRVLIPLPPWKKSGRSSIALGPSIGLPHLDDSAAISLHTNDNEDDNNKDDPSVLTIWIPLNDITNDNPPTIPKTTTAETTTRTMKTTIPSRPLIWAIIPLTPNSEHAAIPPPNRLPMFDPKEWPMSMISTCLVQARRALTSQTSREVFNICDRES